MHTGGLQRKVLHTASAGHIPRRLVTRTNFDAELLQFLYAFKVIFDSLLSSALLPAQPSQLTAHS